MSNAMTNKCNTKNKLYRFWLTSGLDKSGSTVSLPLHERPKDLYPPRNKTNAVGPYRTDDDNELMSRRQRRKRRYMKNPSTPRESKEGQDSLLQGPIQQGLF